jgi:hypothetical protein
MIDMNRQALGWRIGLRKKLIGIFYGRWGTGIAMSGVHKNGWGKVMMIMIPKYKLVTGNMKDAGT